MTVIVLTACPTGLRGDLTRWLLEIAPGVFVGHISARVRERIWLRARAFAKQGRAIMVYSAANEQHVVQGSSAGLGAGRLRRLGAD